MEEHYEEQFPADVPEETPPDQDEEPEAQFPADMLEETSTDQDEEQEAQDAVTMGDLLDEVKTPLFSRPKRGQVVDGVVVQIDPGAILVDIGAKLDGFIHPNEVEQLQRNPETCPQVGDHILVYVVQPRNKDGHAVLSLSRAQAERDWRMVQQRYENQELLDLKVMGYNKGGLIVRLGEVRGFVPATQLDKRVASNNRMEERMKQLSKMVGQTFKLKIIELDRSNNRLILSERLAMREWRDQERDRLLEDLREGEIRKGRVSGLCDFGAFVDIGGADGLVHLSELSWDQVPHPRNVLSVGDEVEVYVLNVDRERKRIALSIKRTRPEPWSNIHQRYQVGQTVTGQVTKLASFGAFVRLEEGIEGLAHISELAIRRIQHPKEVVQEGDEREFRIIRIDSARRRMRLSIKRLEEEAAAEAGEWLEEDVPTPEVLTKGRKRRHRAAAPAAAKSPEEEEELAEWQERLREYQRSLPPSLAKEPETPALAVVEVMEEPKAVVEVAEEPKAVVEVPDEEPPAEAPEPPTEVTEPAEETLEPAAEVEEPAEEVPEPAAEVEEPAEEVPEPAVEVEEPAEGTLEPAAEVEEPAEEAPEPAAEVEELAEESLEPAAEDTELTDETPEPAVETPDEEPDEDTQD